MKSNSGTGLDFKPVRLEDYEDIYRYTSVFGEGSCQHSPVSMFSLEHKYGDEINISDDTLFVHRSRLSDDNYRVYLAPLGSLDPVDGFCRILDDAHGYGKRAKFITLTQKYAEVLKNSFSGRFEIEPERGLSEYVYTTEKMSTFKGGALKKRRNEVNCFWATYGSRAEVRRMTKADFPEILRFEDEWVDFNEETHDSHSLRGEKGMIELQLEHFDELRLSGIILRIDGKVHGFGYGTKLSDDFYDAIAEKGDKNIPHIYKVLRMESVRQCAMDCKYVNIEEDLGIAGLRNLKLAYQPEFLISKYIAVEK